MISPKGLFGYTEGRPRHNLTEWFDLSRLLVPPQETMREGPPPPRLFAGQLVFGGLTLLLVARLLSLQVTQGDIHRYLAEGNRIRRQITIAPRGVILDRHGENLVTNQPGYRLELVPADLPPRPEDRAVIYQALGRDLALEVEVISRQVEEAGFASIDPIILVPHLPREEALAYRLKFASILGVRVSTIPSRRYDSIPGLSHLLGYTTLMTEEDITRRPDYHRASPIGQVGLEASYDEQLRGKAGVNEIEVNANGKFQRALESRPAQVGATLHLTLDRHLQSEMATGLAEAMERSGAKQAAGVVINPNDGGILASVSLPSYDNNLFAQGITPEAYRELTSAQSKPLLNRVVDGLYPAGSTVKPFLAAAALQEGTITPRTTLDTSVGQITIGEWVFPDWKVHGLADVRQAIAESNDIFFYAVGGGWDKIPGLGVERMKRYFHTFGFGKAGGIDFASGAKGLVPDEAWKRRIKGERWYIGDTYHIAIGQGDLLVTPLQLARALASLANGGRLVTPHLVAAIERPAGGKEILTFPEEKVPISPAHLQVAREGMGRAVEAGTSRGLGGLPFSSGGKTGTAQFGSDGKTHAWFIGFAPAEKPEIVAAVIVEGGGEGHTVALPVIRRVFDYFMKYK